MQKKIRLLVVHFSGRMIRYFSYHSGWVANLRQSGQFDCSFLDLSLGKLINRVRLHRWKIANRFDAVVVLHSAFANSCILSPAEVDLLASLKKPLAFFIANEYKEIPEKIEISRRLGTSVFISQCNSEAVLSLYKTAMDCKVTSIPSAALDPSVFFPTTPYDKRELDLGFIGGDEPLYFGHQDRKDISEYFIKNSPGLGLNSRIYYNDSSKRFDRKGYAAFLNRCKAQLGTESGGMYFDLTDDSRNKINDYVATYGPTPPQELFDKFFRDYPNPVPLRIISGRNAEAAGTKTLQILFEGHYSGYMQPNVHYLPLRKDFSNIDEVMRQFRDRPLVGQIIENAYVMAMESLTYAKLLDRLYRELVEFL